MELQERGISCVTCGRSYALARVQELGATPTDRYRRALSHANKHDVDLATAYSELLGILKRGTSPVPTPLQQSTTDTPAEAEFVPTAKPATEYDVGFIPAVAEGVLTVRQAVERGDRVAYASRLNRRHGLSLDVSFLVADNRITLAEARRRHATASRSEIRKAERKTQASGGKIWLASLGALLAATAGFLVWIGWGGGPEVVDPARSVVNRQGPTWKDVELRTDELGRIVRVSAPDPTIVLRRFCRPEPAQQRCEPVEIRAAVSGEPGLRWGIFKPAGKEFGLRAIEIRREGAVRSWTAGDGSAPIDMVAPPEFPPGTPTIPVSWGR